MTERNEQGSIGKTRILIVDDHALIRQGLALLISHEDDLVVSAQAQSAEEALDVLEKEKVDIAVVDISLQGTDGLELTEQIKLHFPGLPVLILSMHDDLLYGHRALRAGAEGYVAKSDAVENIVTEIRRILKKESGASK